MVNGIRVTTVTSQPSTNDTMFVYGPQKFVHPDDQKPFPKPEERFWSNPDQPGFRVQATPEFEQGQQGNYVQPSGPRPWNENYPNRPQRPIQPYYGYGGGRNGYSSVWHPNYPYP